MAQDEQYQELSLETSQRIRRTGGRDDPPVEDSGGVRALRNPCRGAVRNQRAAGEAAARRCRSGRPGRSHVPGGGRVRGDASYGGKSAPGGGGGSGPGVAGLGWADIPWLAGAIICGGVLGPILLLLGLHRTPAATGVVAFALFGEQVARRVWCAIAAVTAGGALLSVDPGANWGVSLGALLVMGACLMWGLDNNFTGRISLKDPKRMVAIKRLAAGGGLSVLLAVALGRPLPALSGVLAALALGTVSYGASIVLYVQSLRRVGAARTGAVFGLAPFVGVGLSLGVFREVPGWTFLAALPLMVIAAVLLARERHEHWHVHAAGTHAHSHRHDDGHHGHRHESEEAGRRHSHIHAHVELPHSHPHRPDTHHRHRHDVAKIPGGKR